MSPLKKNIIPLVLALLLLFSLADMVKASQLNEKYKIVSPPPTQLTEQEKIQQDKALDFLTIVFRLNVSSYDIEEVVTSLSQFDGFMTFKFRSGESELDVSTEFANGELIWCKLYPAKGSPSFITPKSSDALSAAKDTLDRLQAYSAKEYLPTMRNMLNTFTELKNSKTSNADFTQTIELEGNAVKISWEPFANNLNNQQNKLILEFEKGYLMSFHNGLDLYEIGSADVKISEQEAIRIAIEHARAYSWTADDETVSNANVLDNPVIVSLSLQNRGNATLYPLWNIRLPLDKMYPGGVTSFHVLIWADTGEVSSITPIGGYGDQTISPTSSPETTLSAPIPLEYNVAIVTALIATIAIAYLLYKRRR